MTEFEDYLFMRENPKGVHFERWRHAYGCGKWFWPPAAPPRWRCSAPIRRRPLEPPQEIKRQDIGQAARLVLEGFRHEHASGQVRAG